MRYQSSSTRATMMKRSTRAAMALTGLVLTAQPLAGQLRGQDREVEKCATPLGTVAVYEPEAATIQSLRHYQLESPTSLIRMMIQQSNCFQVLERGAAMETMERERKLGRAGEIQQGGNIGGGQMLAADYVLTPDVIFSEGNAGGVGGAVGGLIGRRVGVVAGGLKFKEAQTSMLVSNVRTGIQVAAAQGKAKAADLRLAAFGFLGGAVGGLGGYTNTNEGKVITASFLDNYNNIVIAVRSDPSLAAGASAPTAGAVYNEGDVVMPKIDNIKLLAEPADGAKELGVLKKSEELVYLGPRKDGFIRVQSAAGDGWVKSVLVTKR